MPLGSGDMKNIWNPDLGQMEGEVFRQAEPGPTAGVVSQIYDKHVDREVRGCSILVHVHSENKVRLVECDTFWHGGL